MVSTEKSPGGEVPIIRPGTLEHLEQFETIPAPKFFSLDKYSVAELQNPNHPYAYRMMHQNRRILNKFLNETSIARSFGLFTKRLRIFRPLRTTSIEFDTRGIETQEPWIPILTSTVSRPKASPYDWTMFIHGQPRPWEAGEANLTYDIALPVRVDYSHDPTRPAQAVVVCADGTNRSYNEAAFPEYRQTDPQVMIEALRYASKDFADLIPYVYGVDQAPAYITDEIAGSAPTARKRTVAQAVLNLLK